MKVLDNLDILSVLCKAIGCWGVCFSFHCSPEDAKDAAPWLQKTHVTRLEQIMADGRGYILFKTEEEMNDIYEQTVGDDGPTKKNPYVGPGVYMITCGPDGEFMSENT